MRLEYIRSFADSAQNVMQSVMPSAISQGAVTLKDSLSAHGISATIFLVGGVEGRVVLDLDPPVATKIAGFMNGTEFTHVDHLVLDTICELTNMIIGKAVTSLNNKGFRFRPSPPCFFVGKKACYGLEAVCISLATDWGSMRIQAAIKDKSGAAAAER